jgi:hypothetical protein
MAYQPLGPISALADMEYMADMEYVRADMESIRLMCHAIWI